MKANEAPEKIWITLQWKLSKKQMKDLAFVADQNKSNMVGKTMISLYKDLTKLTEQAMKAPEKLYITNDKKRFSDKCHSASIEKYVDDDIEYVRTDAFIEKACEWLRSHHSANYDDLEEFANKFKRAMKL